MSICRQLDHYKVRKGRYPRSEPSWSPRSPPPGRLVPSSSLWTPISLQGPALRCRIIPGLLRSELNLGSPPRAGRRIPVAATFSFLSFAALVGILGVSLLPTRDQPTFAAEGQRIQPAAPSSTPGVSPQRTAPSPSAEASPRPTAPQGKRPAAPQRKNPRTKKSGGPRRSPAAKARTVGKAQGAAVQTRADVRLGVSGACGLLPGRPLPKRPAGLPEADSGPAADRSTARSVHSRRLPLDRSACNPGPERRASRGSHSRLHLQSGPRLSSCVGLWLLRGHSPL